MWICAMYCEGLLILREWKQWHEINYFTLNGSLDVFITNTCIRGSVYLNRRFCDGTLKLKLII